MTDARFVSNGDTPELGELYVRTAPRLRRAVAATVRAPHWVIEESCQGAWLKLVQRVAEVRPECRFAWLITVAVREALRAVERQAGERSLDELVEQERWGCSATASPHELILQRQRLSAIRTLPDHQQRALWLVGAGLSYRELAEVEGCSERAVERRLYRARQSLRAAA